MVIGAVSRMNEQEVSAFAMAVESERRSLPMAYAAWLFFGLHYGYFKQYWMQIFFWLTFGGFGVWWFLDALRMSTIRKEYYKKLTTGIAKDMVALR